MYAAVLAVHGIAALVVGLRRLERTELAVIALDESVFAAPAGAPGKQAKSSQFHMHARALYTSVRDATSKLPAYHFARVLSAAECRLPALQFRAKSLLPLALLAATLAGCREPAADSADGGPGAPDASRNYPAPRTDLVPSVGLAETFEVATWNVENFPKNENTIATLADLMASLDLDMIVMEEVEDIAAFEELVDRLPGYEGVLSSHTYGDGNYQKLGYIYRSSLVQTSGTFLLFSQDGYEFPRPVLKVDVTVGSGAEAFSFTSLGLHLKAGSSGEDRDRRQLAVAILEDYLRNTVDGNGLDAIITMGDFNETLTGGASVFAPLSQAADRYKIQTAGNSNAGEISFVPSNVLLDHIVTTTEFESAHPGSTTLIPRLDMQMTGYVGQVSDHLPVIMRMPL